MTACYLTLSEKIAIESYNHLTYSCRHLLLSIQHEKPSDTLRYDTHPSCTTITTESIVVMSSASNLQFAIHTTFSFIEKNFLPLLLLILI